MPLNKILSKDAEVIKEYICLLSESDEFPSCLCGTLYAMKMFPLGGNIIAQEDRTGEDTT